jgi:hypothetical protein
MPLPLPLFIYSLYRAHNEPTLTSTPSIGCNIHWLGNLCDCLNLDPSKPKIHLDKSCDLGISLEYKKIDTYLNDV